jgi:L-ascorbate metabolism protein UlaG (beta-lactamase superfamily)
MIGTRNTGSRWPRRLASSCLIASVAVAASIIPRALSGQDEDTLLHASLEPGEAVIWYLYHSGWAIRTASHLLVFDYAPAFRKGDPGSLEDGWIRPDDLGDLRVVVFISHAHSDHFDPSILAWRDRIPALRFVFGWPTPLARDGDVVFGQEREVREVDGVRVLNVHHEFDGIPESAFLVQVDGLTLIHSGDHDHSRGLSQPVFRENIEYLREKGPDLDILFTPTFGDEMGAIRLLDPALVIPMHDGGRERQYRRFADEVASSGLKVKVWAASRPGDRMTYRRTPSP